MSHRPVLQLFFRVLHSVAWMVVILQHCILYQVKLHGSPLCSLDSHHSATLHFVSGKTDKVEGIWWILSGYLLAQLGIYKCVSYWMICRQKLYQVIVANIVLLWRVSRVVIPVFVTVKLYNLCLQTIQINSAKGNFQNIFFALLVLLRTWRCRSTLY